MKVKSVTIKDHQKVFSYHRQTINASITSMRKANVPEVEVQAAVRAYWANVSAQRTA